MDAPQELLRQVRAIPQVREKSGGVFQLLGRDFVRLRETEGTWSAELAKASGTGFDRFPIGEPAQQRKLVDEAKRRATRIIDES